MSIDDIIRKGTAAKALLENSDFTVAIDAVSLQAFKGWSSSELADKEIREQNYYLLQGVKQLKANLEALVANAQFEQHKADREQLNKDRQDLSDDNI